MFKSTKNIELGSCAFRQPQAKSHCRFLHGYQLTAKFWFESDQLDENNWVVDFGALKGLKELLKNQFLNIFIGIIIGIIFHFSTDVLRTIGMSGTLPIFFATYGVPLISIFFLLGILIHTEDG